MLLSVDSTGLKFEYLRYPAKWDICYQNIKKYQAQSHIVTIDINYSVSFHNIFYIDEFYLWCIKEKLPIPNFNIVYGPAEFNIKNIPQAAKTAITQKLHKFRPFSNILEFMNQRQSTVHIDQIIKKINDLDLIRKQNFAKIFPEFYNLISK